MKDLPDTAKDFVRQDWHALPTDAIAAELAADPVRAGWAPPKRSAGSSYMVPMNSRRLPQRPRSPS